MVFYCPVNIWQSAPPLLPFSSGSSKNLNALVFRKLKFGSTADSHWHLSNSLNSVWIKLKHPKKLDLNSSLLSMLTFPNTFSKAATASWLAFRTSSPFTVNIWSPCINLPSVSAIPPLTMSDTNTPVSLLQIHIWILHYSLVWRSFLRLALGNTINIVSFFCWVTLGSFLYERSASLGTKVVCTAFKTTGSEHQTPTWARPVSPSHWISRYTHTSSQQYSAQGLCQASSGALYWVHHTCLPPYTGPHLCTQSDELFGESVGGHLSLHHAWHSWGQSHSPAMKAYNDKVCRTFQQTNRRCLVSKWQQKWPKKPPHL